VTFFGFVVQILLCFIHLCDTLHCGSRITVTSWNPERALISHFRSWNLPGWANCTCPSLLGCIAGAGLFTVSASICNGVAGCDVVTPTISSRSSTQQGQSVIARSVVVDPSVVGRLATWTRQGRCSVLDGMNFRNIINIGRCQYFEVRTIRDRIMLRIVNAYTHVSRLVDMVANRSLSSTYD
jgi:hypothetical protein